MQNILSFPVSPGDVKWGVLFMILLGVIFLFGAWKSWKEYRETKAKRYLVGLVLWSLVALAMIPAEMVLRSYTSATIVLDGTGVWVYGRPMLKDQGLAYEDIVRYQTTTITQLGGVSRSSGYSDGTERTGWFKMHRNGKKIYVCSVGDEVLLVEGKNGDILLLGPPDRDRFLAEFEQRMQGRKGR
jgi:hypothetical protein